MDTDQQIIGWLRGTNTVQRNVVRTPAGRDKVEAEADLSGGLSALLNLLRSDAPISRRIRDALARSLDPHGDSILHIKQRASRVRGRPSADSSVRDAVRKVYVVVRHPNAAARAEAAVRKSRPIPAVGTKPKKVTTGEKILKLRVSRSEHYRRMCRRKSLKSRNKKCP